MKGYGTMQMMKQNDAMYQYEYQDNSKTETHIRI